MHQLILLRHAQAVPFSAQATDHDRALTPRGTLAAASIGRAMRSAGVSPDVVLVSSALRTQQTFTALEAASVWDEWPNIDTIPALYMATKTQLLEILRNLPETVRSALAIGHNPGLHELAIDLSGPRNPRPDLARLHDSYPTATLTEFLVTTPWRRLAPGAATLQRYLPAADLV
ncbi:MAG: histidine phosphatase family protein [Acidocella sp.]|nr:histidine phosphatase family protein [Acidocella sp.]